MTTIARYIVREIAGPLAVVLGVVVILFASYSATEFMSDAVNGLLPTRTIADLIGLKVLIALEVLIPIALYVATILALSRLYSESEVLAMFALTITPARILRTVVLLSFGIALLVAALSLFGRPWAYRKMHEYSARAEATVSFDDMEPGTFYEDRNGRWVIFIGERTGPERLAGKVLIRCKVDGHEQTIFAQHAREKPTVDANAPKTIELEQVRLYELGAAGTGRPDMTGQAQAMSFDLGFLHADPPGYSSVAAPTAALARSGSLGDVAEFQWRLSTPLSTLLLGLLAVPLSRTQPRQGKYAKMGLAIALYSTYYMLCTTARTWVQKGSVATVPGIWWVPLLLLCAIAAMTVSWQRPPRLRI